MVHIFCGPNVVSLGMSPVAVFPPSYQPPEVPELSELTVEELGLGS